MPVARLAADVVCRRFAGLIFVAMVLLLISLLPLLLLTTNGNREPPAKLGSELPIKQVESPFLLIGIVVVQRGDDLGFQIIQVFELIADPLGQILYDLE